MNNRETIMRTSQHATLRTQQRAIPELAIELLMRFGSSQRAGNGTCKYFLDKGSRRRLEAYAGPAAAALSEHLNVIVVVGDDGTIVTAAHRTERIRRH